MRASTESTGSAFYAGHIDLLTDLLDGVRARGAVLYRAGMDRGWSIRIADGAPLMLVAVIEGHMWVLIDDAEPVRVGPGDVAIVSLRSPYTVADEPGIAPQLVALPGDRYTTPGGVDVTEKLQTGRRTASATPGADTTIVVYGTYQVAGDVDDRLLAALPDVLVVPAGEVPDWVVGRLEDEVVRDEPGQQLVLDRLLDLTLIVALRGWFARPGAPVPGWYRAQADAVVGQALTLIHENPAHPWTVTDLAAEAGVSRAWFARRFTELLGESPIRYLTGRRMAIAADRLRGTDSTIAGIAHEVGYADAFSFSAAFTRTAGVRPSDYRNAYRTGHSVES
ncbi:AraC-like DNA-binding protein [Rhodococcus sp. SMB37]|uniref:AraC family transcriptional regulator n=1 Tax=Rhodococcus sp. SMB37 TaxID=2512213 RepID=UPI000A6A9CB1|nr:AraC family transcriptional regulator [Rhodococcus sp. SMB37]TCN57033.1 AraC-like DNA-binding protein [Rhodococcus sp. SMB37]